MLLPSYLCLLLLALSFTSDPVAAKKKSDHDKWIQEVDNAKNFKKLLRTKTNILVMFAANENAARKKFDVFGDVALEMKGSATCAWIDCSTKEGKKICKKQKAVTDPVQLQHYKDGEFSTVYERKFTAKSIKAFLKNPTGDGPWEEEDSAKDVVHIDSEKQLNKLIKKNNPMLVMFYAPWCGFCKRFKPVFSEVATELKGKVIMAGVDAENNKDASSIRETYNITGFPKSIYFENGKQRLEYSGGHAKQELIDWLDDPQEPKPKEPEMEWSDNENDVDHLTDANFDTFIAENSKVMVFFYAPWCGHCKNLKPDWEKAATQLKEEEAPEKLAAMDATKYREIGDRYKVKGYPTVIYFENGEQKYDASSAFKRTVEGIIEYIKDAKEPPPPEKAWNEIESDVEHYDDSSFKGGVRKKKHALIMFYAPWCGHCKKAKPEFQNAAAKFADDKKVVFGAVDCTISRSVCETYDVKGYPTFYYLSYGKNEAKYQSGRETSDFVKFIEDKDREANATEKFEKALEFWKDIPHSDLLHKLTDETWSDFVHSHRQVLVTIYSWECPNCQHIRKSLAEAAQSAKKEKLPVELAVIDGDRYGDQIYRMWTPDMGVPTLFWYEKGVRRFEYTKARGTSELLEFLRNPKKPEERKKFSDWSMEESAEDIYHLEDSGFDSFASDQEDMLVFFYSPRCQACYQARKMYENASSILDKENPDVTLAAVNLAKGNKLKEKYDINSYPYFAYFRKGKFKYQYNGLPVTDAIVTFMKKPKFIPKPPTLEDWADVASNVTILSKKNFRKFIKKHDQVLVMFYANWCGHCKRFKPEFQKAADRLLAHESTAKLAAIDGDHSKKLMKSYDVSGFPTLLHFRHGKLIERYNGQRTADAVVKFLSESDDKTTSSDCDVDGECAADDAMSESRPEQVALLTPNNFDDVSSEAKQMLVMFYSPNCGACKSAKKPFFQAALEANEDLPGTKFALFDAAKYRSFVESFSIKGYPTFWYFQDGEKRFKYHGERSKRAFLNFLHDPKEKTDPAPRDSTVQWISESSRVEHLNRENFESFVKKNEHVLVFFYINMCKICFDVIKPEYVKAAARLHENRIPSRLTAINGDWERPLIAKYGVDSYPSFLYFRNGVKKYLYHGGRKAKDFVKFMTKPREELARRRKPTSWQDLSPDHYGSVVHLGNKTYDEFIKNRPSVLVMFHSLHYDRCKVARDNFRRAADIFSKDPDVGMGAVDCHRQPEQGLVCYHQHIKKFPLYKYYQNGKFQLDLPAENTKDIVNFMLMKSKERVGKDEL